MAIKKNLDPARAAIGRARRRDHLMPTRHKMNPNWTYRGDNTKYKEKK